MTANTNRGEVDIEIGGEVRTLRFATQEIVLLEDRLGCDVLTYLGAGKGQLKFCVEAVFCGLSRSAKANKMNPLRVAGWFDQFTGSLGDMQRDILYAIAKGKPGEEGLELVKVLDETFRKADEPARPTTSTD